MMNCGISQISFNQISISIGQMLINLAQEWNTSCGRRSKFFKCLRLQMTSLEPSSQQSLSSKITSTGSETKCDRDGGWSCRWLFCHCLCLCHCHCLCLCLAGGFRHCLCLFLCHCHSLGFSVIDHQKYFQKVETLSEALQLTQMMIISSMAYKNFSGIPAGTPFFWLESWLAKLTWGGKGGDRTY